MRKRFTTGHFIAALAVWTALCSSYLLTVALLSHSRVLRALLLMATGLGVLWVGLFGALSRSFRDSVREQFEALHGRWQLKFVLFCTVLALIEEAVTVSMTNLAPVFGVPIGKAYITASTNYLDVVCLHSVVVLVPQFAAWAWMLSRWKFYPNAALLLYGLTGIVGETIFGGLQPLVALGMWIFVYGLMVYLPTYCVPDERPARQPPWWSYPAAIILPVLCSIPVALIVMHFHPIKVHFPPMKP